MVAIKVFDSKGKKSVELMGNVSEQIYDVEIEEETEDDTSEE